MNAFMIFARKRRPQISAANQMMRTGDVSKILSKEWNSMEMVGTCAFFSFLSLSCSEVGLYVCSRTRLCHFFLLCFWVHISACTFAFAVIASPATRPRPPRTTHSPRKSSTSTKPRS